MIEQSTRSTLNPPRGYIDAHCHLQDPRVDAVRDEWIARAADRGLTRFCLGGVSPEDWVRQEKLHSQVPERYALTAGLHPWWVSEAGSGASHAALSALRECLADPRYVALGETGLDHQDRFTESARATQADLFRAQLDLAAEFEKPLILHIVRAHSAALEVLAAQPLNRGGIVHSFSAAPELARAYRAHGLLLSISAAVATRGSGKAFHHLRSTVIETGLSDLTLETDAPDQPAADVPRVDGHPALNPVETLFRVAEIIAEWKGESPETVLRASTENWERVFRRS